MDKDALAFFEQFGDGEPVDIRDQDVFIGSIEGFEPDAQLNAIRSVIRDNRRSVAGLQEQMDDMGKRGEEYGLSEPEIDNYGALFYLANYRNAANSLVAAAMLNALLEEIFERFFEHLNNEHGANIQLKPLNRVSQVDHNVAVASSNGVLFDADEVARYRALLKFRNCIVHSALEWTDVELRNCETRMAQDGWPAAWFPAAKTNGVATMYSISDDLVDQLMIDIDLLIARCGAAIKQMLGR